MTSAIAGVAGGCSWQDTLVDGTFTPAQWQELQTELAFDPPSQRERICYLAGVAEDQCGNAIVLGSQLFTDPRVSGDGTVSCATCHAMPTWTDPRAPNNVSLGAEGKWTKRNALTLWDEGYKLELYGKFGWDGAYLTPGQVIERALTPMASSIGMLVQLIETDGNYATLFEDAFALSPSDDGSFSAHIEQAFTAYMIGPPFITAATPFDHYLQGDETAISDSAKRGFAVFVGRGTCIECHSGPLFTDFRAHDTGVPQQGAHVPATDVGAGSGAFFTPTLREIASTGPYMHDGVFATLSDVIAFYRSGGGGYTDYSGTRDPRIQPLDLTDQDALDLEAFLDSLSQATASTGSTGSGSGMPPDAGVRDAPMMTCPPGFAVCMPDGPCQDVFADPMNCGMCGHTCGSSQGCYEGNCM
ncbi:MAG TPA: cytochrome c peroxidase [Kofleriaceae bacterium]|nr:cytochrome c peroxidase [Kofleriaceae bacterium]